MILNFFKKEEDHKYDFIFKPSPLVDPFNCEQILVDVKKTNETTDFFDFLNNVPEALEIVKECIKYLPIKKQYKNKLSLTCKNIKHVLKCMIEDDKLFVKYTVLGLATFPKELICEHVDDTYCIIIFDTNFDVLFQNSLCTRIFGNWKFMYFDNHLNFIDNVIIENTDFLNYIKNGISNKRTIYETCIKMETIIDVHIPKCSFDTSYGDSRINSSFSTLFNNVQNTPHTEFFSMRLIPNDDDDNVVMLLKSCNNNKKLIQNTLTLRTTINIVSSMLPKHVVEFLCNKQIEERDLSTLSRNHDNVVILFTDIVHWTTICGNTVPSIAMGFLNRLYTIYDDLANKYNIYKLETVGDCYVCVSGLTKQDKNGIVELVENKTFDVKYANSMVQFAKQLLINSQSFSTPDGNPLQIRIGIHVGSVSSGVIGYSMPKFVLTGDAMNMASRMESTCQNGCIQITRQVYDYLDRDSRQGFFCNRDVFVKGKGLMDVYVLKL